MSQISPVLDFVHQLLTDPEAQARFDTDPDGTLRAAGLSDVPSEDVYDIVHQMAGHSRGGYVDPPTLDDFEFSLEDHKPDVGGKP